MMLLVYEIRIRYQEWSYAVLPIEYDSTKLAYVINFVRQDTDPEKEYSSWNDLQRSLKIISNFTIR